MNSSRLEYWRLSGVPARQTQDEKRHDEAVADAKRAIQLAPGSADAAELASYVLAASGHPEEAAVQSEKAMALNVNYPAVYPGTLGDAYRLSGRNEGIAAFKAYGARSAGFGLIHWGTSGQYADIVNRSLVTQSGASRRQLPDCENSNRSPHWTHLHGHVWILISLFLPFLTLKDRLHFDSSSHQLVTPELQAFSNFFSQAWDSRAAKA